MSLGFDPTPAVGDLHTVAGKTWRWNGAGWEKYTLLNTFQAPVRQNWYETLVTSASNPVTNMVGVQLTYL